jgi:predicted transcriptional regulator
MNALTTPPIGGHGVERLLDKEHEDERILLGLLNSVELGGERSQRRIAAELGIALGLVNSYIKRCVMKGWVKVRTAPPRRYAYYLTPHGFAEKSRLTVQYLSDSFSFFRLARADCARVIAAAQARGFSRVVLAGKSDLAEIAILCAVEAAVTIVAIVDARSNDTQFIGVNVFKSYAEVAGKFDAVIVTDVTTAQTTFAAAIEACDADHVLAPTLLGLPLSETNGGAA